MRAFLATAEEGSFSGAARVLKTTPPTIGRQIGALEEALGVTLVERRYPGFMLTEVGRELIDHVRAMGETATLISMVADGKSQEGTGEVTVTGTDLLSAAVLPGVLMPLRATVPGIHMRVIVRQSNATTSESAYCMSASSVSARSVRECREWQHSADRVRCCASHQCH